MREIKFRAWDKGSKQWVDDVLLTCNKYGFIYQNHYKCEFMGEDRDIELCQYTGLKDKNEKEIYEGDIVKIDIGGGLELYTINWDNEDTSFKAFSKTGEYRFIAHPTTIVVGNKYENKELMICP